MEMHGHLISSDPDKNMKIYIGTKNPGSTLNPWQSGRVIWAVSDNYSSMVSSGQIATTSGGSTTRIHPSAITVDDDDNQVLTQRNFAAHAYRRIKSWVKLWIADWITINGTKHTIWKGIDEGAYMGKLRDLPGQGRNNYSYTPGSNDDCGGDESAEGDGEDLGYFTTPEDMQNFANQVNSQIYDMNNQLSNIAQKYGGSYDPESGTITVPIQPSQPVGDSTVDLNTTTSQEGMLTFTQAHRLGLGPKSGNYSESIGTIAGGTDGNMYVLKLYSPTGRKHWYKAYQ